MTVDAALLGGTVRRPCLRCDAFVRGSVIRVVAVLFLARGAPPAQDGGY